MKRLKSVENDQVGLEVGECDCGYHFGVDASFLEQVTDFTFECPSCGRRIDTGELFHEKWPGQRKGISAMAGDDFQASCENCGKPCEYHSELCLCPTCIDTKGCKKGAWFADQEGIIKRGIFNEDDEIARYELLDGDYPDDWRRQGWKDDVQTIHETVVKKWAAWSEEDRRFLALALAGEVGGVLSLIKQEWRGDLDRSGGFGITEAALANRAKLEEEMGDARIFLELLAMAHNIDLDEVCCHLVDDKLMPRWPEAAKKVLERREKEAR